MNEKKISDLRKRKKDSMSKNDLLKQKHSEKNELIF